MNIQEMNARADEASGLMKALANRHRLMILCQLHQGERSVGELEDLIGLSQSALSQHLARLRADALVATRRDAQTIFYSLADERVSRVIATLYDLFCPPPASKRKGKGKSASTAP
jgi:DNA-binding transcriptional ArsR family regulator